MSPTKTPILLFHFSFNALDLVKLITTEKEVDDTSLSNDFIHGIQSTASLYQKLSKDEYATEVKPFVKEKEKALEKGFFAEDHQQTISTSELPEIQPRTKDDKRLELMQKLRSTPNTQLEGPHFYQLFVEDPTISEKLERIYGHKAHVQHLFQGFLSQSWTFNDGKRRGQHTEVSIFMRQHSPMMETNNALQCRLCDKQIKGKQRKNQMRKHMKDHALTAANDLPFEQVKVVIQDYFMHYFDVEWDASEMDKLAKERMLLSE
ncbi:hypothetical protein MAM1_0024d02040 [Mucor ambiguus]|uniref:Uncharacterized protein n=1 Tax=Mucor ambiguus TaxID=91626 RepID=A0A0C9M1Z3_9FUNG|nr:hypothetical protein MAM1_0024d02040 [Mucor ambiguus]